MSPPLETDNNIDVNCSELSIPILSLHLTLLMLLVITLTVKIVIIIFAFSGYPRQVSVAIRKHPISIKLFSSTLPPVHASGGSRLLFWGGRIRLEWRVARAEGAKPLTIRGFGGAS